MKTIQKKIKILATIDILDQSGKASENSEQLTPNELNQIAGGRNYTCPPRPSGA